MRKFKKKKVLIVFLLSFLLFGSFLFSSQFQNSSYPDPRNYAPNFWFDSEEKYFPCNPLEFNYDENLNEIPAEKAKEKYDRLTKEEKLNHFTVFYKVVDEKDQWIYEYHLYYVFNEFMNEHYGDWERVDVYVDKISQKPVKVIGFAHNGSKTKIILANNELDNPKADHQRILVEKGSHASCPDGNYNGMPDKFVDTSNKNSYLNTWIGSYSDWSLQDKLYGPKVEWSDERYKLVSIEDLKREYSQKYSLQKRLISKAKNLGIDILSLTPITKKVFSSKNKHLYIARKLAGSPPSNPWQREEYERPQIAQPIKNPIKNIAQAFSQKIETLALKAKSFGAKIKSFFGKKEKKSEKFAGGSKVGEEKRSFLKATIEEKVFKESEKEIKNITQKAEKENQAGLEEELKEEKENEKIKVIRAEDEMKTEEKIESEKERRIKKEKKQIKEIKWCSIEENLAQPKHEIIFNEIAWMGTKISSQNEWIELKNLTSKEINLSGYQLQSKDGKIKIAFSEIKLPPFGLLLLERSDDDTLPQIKADLIYKGSIRNSNEALFLFDKNCQLEDKVEANPFWPAGDNDSKRTMERKTDLSWQTSFLPGGTPKKENSSGYFEEASQIAQKEKAISKTYPKILISEVYLGSENNPKDEFVELYNPNDQEVDLSGWYLQRKTKNAKKFSSYASSKLFSNKKIPGKGYLLIAREGSSFEKIADVIVNKPLTFNNTLVLKNPARKIVDEVFWKEVPPAKSYGRKWENGTYKDTNNCFYDFEIQKPTPKAKNSKAKEISFSGGGGGFQIILAVGGGKKEKSKEKVSQISFCQIPSSLNPTHQVIFSEIAWAGALDNASDEWIELFNFSQKEINLKNWQILGVNLKNNQTKIKFVFEKDLKIKPRGFVLLERSDDETVPQIPADGIFTGSINNSDFAFYLFDPQCQLSDFVLASSTWPAGGGEEKRSMERDENLNWHSYFGPPQTFGSKIIFGTPKAENSTSTTSTISTTFPTSSTSTLPSLLISELYFGTSSKIRFLEIYNPNDFEINLDDFSVQYLGGKSQIKEFSTSSIDLEKFSSKIKKFNLSGSIKPFGYYLIASTSSVFGIKADKVFKTFNPALTGGTIFLVASQDRLASPTSTQIIDQLAWGTSSKLGALFPEKAPAPPPIKNSSLERKAFKDSTLENFPCWQNFGRSFDSQDNSFDFILQNSPTPQNSQSFSQNPEKYFLPLPLPQKIKSSFSSSSLTLNLSWQIPENFPFKNFFTKIYLVTSTQENLSSSTLLELSKTSFSTTTATSTSIKIKSFNHYLYFGLSFESPLCQKASEIVWQKIFIPSFIKNAYFYQAKYRNSQNPKYFLEIEFETKDWISTSDEYPSLILVNLNQTPSKEEFLSATPHGPHPWIPEKIDSFLAFLLKRSSSSLTFKGIYLPEDCHWHFDSPQVPQTDENDLTLRIPFNFNASLSTSSYFTFSFYQRRLNTYYLLGFDLKKYYFGQKPQFYPPQKPKISFSLDENLPSIVKASVTPSIDQDSLDKKLFYQVHLIEKEASSTFIFDVRDNVKRALSMTPLPYHLQENDEFKVLVEVFDEFSNSNSASSTFIYPFKVKKEFVNGKPSSNWRKFGYKTYYDDRSFVSQNFSLEEKISFNLLALRFKPKRACRSPFLEISISNTTSSTSTPIISKRFQPPLHLFDTGHNYQQETRKQIFNFNPQKDFYFSFSTTTLDKGEYRLKIKVIYQDESAYYQSWSGCGQYPFEVNLSESSQLYFWLGKLEK